MPRLRHRAALLSLLLVSCGAPTEPTPTLRVSPLDLLLPAAPATGTFDMTVSPAGKSVDWSVKAKPEWVTLSLDHGTVSGGVVKLTVTVTPPPLREPGKLTAVIELTTTGGDVNLGVETSVLPSGHISYSPTSLEIPAGNNVGTITLTNDGTGSVSWRAGSSVSWLTPDPLQGYLTTGQSAVVTVAVQRAAMPQGTSTGSISIFSGMASVADQIPVTVLVAPPPP